MESFCPWFFPQTPRSTTVVMCSQHQARPTEPRKAQDLIQHRLHTDHPTELPQDIALYAQDPPQTLHRNVYVPHMLPAVQCTAQKNEPHRTSTTLHHPTQATTSQVAHNKTFSCRSPPPRRRSTGCISCTGSPQGAECPRVESYHCSALYGALRL